MKLRQSIAALFAIIALVILVGWFSGLAKGENVAFLAPWLSVVGLVLVWWYLVKKWKL